MKKAFDSVEMMRSIRNSIRKDLRKKAFDEAGELDRIREQYRISNPPPPSKVAEQTGEYGVDTKPLC
ncbi:MAG TPA: hypothetical protein VKF42_00485 [Chitinivibrionales bacterium]|jgi:hypothetical protein|nr:hypothetical protein [Chitinivibrionales bacterium]